MTHNELIVLSIGLGIILVTIGWIPGHIIGYGMGYQQGYYDDAQEQLEKQRDMKVAELKKLTDDEYDRDWKEIDSAFMDNMYGVEITDSEAAHYLMLKENGIS